MKSKTLEQKIRNMIFTFQVRSIVQKSQPEKDIPEIDTGILEGESIKRLVDLFQSELEEFVKEIRLKKKERQTKGGELEYIKLRKKDIRGNYKLKIKKGSLPIERKEE